MYILDLIFLMFTTIVCVHVWESFSSVNNFFNLKIKHLAILILKRVLLL